MSEQDPTDSNSVLNELRAQNAQIITKLDAQDAKAEERVVALAEFRKDVCEHLHALETNFDLLKGQLEVEQSERAALEARVTRASTGAKNLSTSDAQQDAAIGLIRAQIDSIEKKTDMQTALLAELRDGAKKLSENKLVQLGVLILTYLAIRWLSNHGIEVK